METPQAHSFVRSFIQFTQEGPWKHETNTQATGTKGDKHTRYKGLKSTKIHKK